ncbi:hypothetical protein V8B97DRAFT_2021917 [Scleroderma yunnanense]
MPQSHETQVQPSQGVVNDMEEVALGENNEMNQDIAMGSSLSITDETPVDDLEDDSNYNSDAHAAKAKRAIPPSGNHSSFSLSLPPEELHHEDTDTELEVDIDEENPLPRCKKRKTSQSGKRAKAMMVEGSNNVLSCQHNKLPISKKPDVLSNVALDEICLFSNEDILTFAGFGVKPVHTKINEANLFHFRDEFNDIIMKEYNDLMKDILKDDVARRREKLKHVYEWNETCLVAPSNKSVKLITAKLENAKVQFSGLAESWSNLKEIEIVSILMYVREDSAGCQLSGIFGGSDMIRKFVNNCAIDVHALMDKYTSIFKYVFSSIHCISGMLDLCCCPREVPRDWDHHGGDPQKITWQRLLEFVRKNHLITTNWPLGIPSPGPGFNYKKLKAGSLHKLVVPYLQRKLGRMYDGQTDDEESQDLLVELPEIEVKLWHEDIICIPDTNPTKGDVALIRASDSTWQKIQQAVECKHQEVAATWPKKNGPSHKQLGNNQDGSNAPSVPLAHVDNINVQPSESK